jgi:hypothetical protein
MRSFSGLEWRAVGFTPRISAAPFLPQIRHPGGTWEVQGVPEL